MQQTVLITGGSGLVGQALAKALVKKGYAVIILSRTINGKTATHAVSYVAWDVKKRMIDIPALQAADHIIHLAGAGVVDRKWTPAYRKEIIESRTESSKLLIDALKKNSNKVKTIVSASAIGWYGADKYPVIPFTETDCADSGFLGETCRLWEQSIEPAEQTGRRLVKLRIGIVLSNHGGALAEFKKPLQFGMAAILGSGRQMVSWIDIDDLCSMFIYAMEQSHLSGSYNAVAPNPVSNKTLTLAIARAFRRSFYIPFRVPSFILQLIMGERSIEVLKSATVSCKKIMDAGFAFQYKSIDSCLRHRSETTDLH